jgi:hypothetical protein
MSTTSWKDDVMDTDELALHGLAVKKAGDAAAVARIMDLPADEIAAALDRAAAAGDVLGARGMFMLTPQGRSGLESRAAQTWAQWRAEEPFAAAYDRFEVINREILDLFTRWQQVDVGGQTVPNDHSDAGYDDKLIDELGALHERAARVLGRFTASMPRFGAYERRLDEAYDRVLGGDADYFTGVRVDSYHTVWFEMHEDLLRILGRTRES